MPVSTLQRDSFRPYLPQVLEQGKGLAPLVLALMRHETSNLNTRAVSRVGAKGLLQLMPVVFEPAKINPFNPQDNIRVGINLMKGIQRVLHETDPTRFPPPGTLPKGFARKVTIGGWVRGYSRQAGIASLMDKYKGSSWEGFLNMFPSWNKQDNWISAVDRSTDDWQGILAGKETPQTLIAKSGPGAGSLLILALLIGVAMIWD